MAWLTSASVNSPRVAFIVLKVRDLSLPVLPPVLPLSCLRLALAEARWYLLWKNGSNTSLACGTSGSSFIDELVIPPAVVPASLEVPTIRLYPIRIAAEVAMNSLRARYFCLIYIPDAVHTEVLRERVVGVGISEESAID